MDLSQISVALTFNNMLKYFLEGLAIVFASKYIVPPHRFNMQEAMLLGAVAALAMMVLDMYAPLVGNGLRQGAGFGIGSKLVGFP